MFSLSYGAGAIQRVALLVWLCGIKLLWRPVRGNPVNRISIDVFNVITGRERVGEYKKFIDHIITAVGSLFNRFAGKTVTKCARVALVT